MATQNMLKFVTTGREMPKKRPAPAPDGDYRSRPVAVSGAFAVCDMVRGAGPVVRARGQRAGCKAAGLAAACVASWLALSSAGAATFMPPQGCELQMTVQLRGCVAAQHFTCSADAPGDQWVTYFDREGARFTSRIDAETRWMESIDLRSGLVDRLEPGAMDHASFSTLLRTGHDGFDFWTRSNSGERLRNIGEDRLTGETATIDGVKLELTEFTLRVFAEDGRLLIQSQGQQFISREHGRFYGGVEESSDWTGAHHEKDDSPVTFAFPGDAGFASTNPVFGCDMQMVRAAPPAMSRHDG